MLTDEKLIRLKDLQVKPETSIKLKNYETYYTGKTLNKEDAETLLDISRRELSNPPITA